MTSSVFENFLIFVVSHAAPDRPTITFQYVQDPDVPDKKDWNSIGQFCFPNDIFEQQILLKDWKKSETFSFMLTEIDGSRRFGFCRRKIDITTAKCLCFISNYGYFQFFRQVLEVIDGQQKAGTTDEMIKLLDQIASIQVPERREKGVDIPIQLPFSQISLTLNPANSEFGDVPLDVLFSSLSIRNIFHVLGSIVCERRIIFSSSNLSTLSSSAMSMCALLFPFTWQYIFIPILPQRLLHYCCAPMPFIVGVHASDLIGLESMPLESTVFVDLDQNKFVSQTEDEDFAVLPPQLLQALKAVIKPVVSAGKKMGNMRCDLILEAFLNFWIAIYGKYKDFIVSEETGKLILDRDKFESSLSKPLLKFHAIFKQSQMFEQFARGCVIEPKKSSFVLFDEECHNRVVHVDPTDLTSDVAFFTSSERLRSLFAATFRPKKEAKKEKEQTHATLSNPAAPSPPPDYRQSVRMAIGDILEQQYRNSNTQLTRDRRERYSVVDWSHKLQTTAIHEPPPPGVMSLEAMNELKRRLAEVSRDHRPLSPPVNRPPLPPRASESYKPLYSQSGTNIHLDQYRTTSAMPGLFVPLPKTRNQILLDIARPLPTPKHSDPMVSESKSRPRAKRRSISSTHVPDLLDESPSTELTSVGSTQLLDEPSIKAVNYSRPLPPVPKKKSEHQELRSLSVLEPPSSSTTKEFSPPQPQVKEIRDKLQTNGFKPKTVDKPPYPKTLPSRVNSPRANLGDSSPPPRENTSHTMRLNRALSPPPPRRRENIINRQTVPHETGSTPNSAISAEFLAKIQERRRAEKANPT